MNSSPKIIGEGAYGCVFKPSLPCSDKKITYKNKISKFMLTKAALKEIGEYAIIANADSKADFYTGKPTRCTMKNTAENMTAVSKCKVYQKNLKNKTAKEIEKETSLLLITDGGDDLVKWVEKTTTSSRTNIINFWKETLRLFRGLKAFNTHSLMHHDLKPQNVVYNMEMKRLNFIDFGLMRSIKTEALKCSAAKGCVANSHWNYPTDVIFMGKSIYNLAVKNRGAFYDEYYKMIGKDNPFGNAYSIFIRHIFDTKNDARKKAFEIRFWQGFKELINKLPANGYANFLDVSLKGFDVFGLGLTLMYVLSRTKQMLDPKSITLMDDLFFRMMTPNIYARLSIEEATKEYEKVLASL